MRMSGSSWSVYSVGIRLVSAIAMEQGGANENICSSGPVHRVGIRLVSAIAMG